MYQIHVESHRFSQASFLYIAIQEIQSNVRIPEELRFFMT